MVLKRSSLALTTSHQQEFLSLLYIQFVIFPFTIPNKNHTLTQHSPLSKVIPQLSRLLVNILAFFDLGLWYTTAFLVYSSVDTLRFNTRQAHTKIPERNHGACHHSDCIIFWVHSPISVACAVWFIYIYTASLLSASIPTHWYASALSAMGAVF